MNAFVKTLATAVLGFGFSVGVAQAALQPKAKPDVQAARPAAKEADRPVVAPEGCLAKGAAATCTAEKGAPRAGTPVRVIPLYKVTKVDVCRPDAGDCLTRR